MGWGVCRVLKGKGTRRGEMGCRVSVEKDTRWDGGGGSEGVEQGKGGRRARG